MYVSAASLKMYRRPRPTSAFLVLIAYREQKKRTKGVSIGSRQSRAGTGDETKQRDIASTADKVANG
jgi:hypothetical protein